MPTQTLNLTDTQQCSVTTNGLDEDNQPGQLPSGPFNVVSSDPTIATIGNISYPTFNVVAAGVGTCTVSASVIGPNGQPVFPADSFTVVVSGGPDTQFTFTFGTPVPIPAS